ncbi:MAG: hypothetical protein ACR2OD_03980 [Gaiellaceae bacterium]
MLARVQAIRESANKLKFRAIWMLVGLAGLVVLAALFWRALLGIGFAGVLVFALWRTRDRLSWLQVLAALALLTIFALIFWRTWLIVAMAVVLAAVAVGAKRLSRPAPE